MVRFNFKKLHDSNKYQFKLNLYIGKNDWNSYSNYYSYANKMLMIFMPIAKINIWIVRKINIDAISTL